LVGWHSVLPKNSLDGDEKMKKLTVILATPLVLAFTMVCILSTPAQDTNAKIYMDDTDQNWPSTSGPKIASRDLPKALGSWENSEMYKILDFVDKSIKERNLLGYESDPIFGADPYRGERLNIMKDKISTAANLLENGNFDEACQDLLDAYSGTDGLSQTPDLVYGQAAPELAKMIEYMRIEIIGCK
jgi:hypothetical protein